MLSPVNGDPGSVGVAQEWIAGHWDAASPDGAGRNFRLRRYRQNPERSSPFSLRRWRALCPRTHYAEKAFSHELISHRLTAWTHLCHLRPRNDTYERNPPRSPTTGKHRFAAAIALIRNCSTEHPGTRARSGRFDNSPPPRNPLSSILNS